MQIPLERGSNWIRAGTRFHIQISDSQESTAAVTCNYCSGVFVQDSGAQLAAHSLSVVVAADRGKAGSLDVTGLAGIPAGKLRCGVKQTDQREPPESLLRAYGQNQLQVNG